MRSTLFLILSVLICIQGGVARAEEPGMIHREKLLGGYHNYILARACHEIRSGYAIVYVNDEDFAKAKMAIEYIEKQMVDFDPTIDTDAVWAKAMDDIQILLLMLQVNGSDFNDETRSMCNQAIRHLALNSENPLSGDKDF